MYINVHATILTVVPPGPAAQSGSSTASASVIGGAIGGVVAGVIIILVVVVAVVWKLSYAFDVQMGHCVDLCNAYCRSYWTRKKYGVVYMNRRNDQVAITDYQKGTQCIYSIDTFTRIE